MDPQQRLLLHTVQSALDDAGYVPDATPTFQRATIGCYVGVATGDYTDNLRENIDVFYSPGKYQLQVPKPLLAGLFWTRDIASFSQRENFFCSQIQWTFNRY